MAAAATVTTTTVVPTTIDPLARVLGEKTSDEKQAALKVLGPKTLTQKHSRSIDFILLLLAAMFVLLCAYLSERYIRKQKRELELARSNSNPFSGLNGK